MEIYVIKGYSDPYHPNEFQIISVFKNEKAAEDEAKKLINKHYYYDIEIESCMIKDM